MTPISYPGSRRAVQPEDEFSAAMQPMLDAIATAAPLAPGDWTARRAAVERGLHLLSRNLPAVRGVGSRLHRLDSGTSIVEFSQHGSNGVTAGSPTLVYAHGGGRFAGTVSSYEPVLRTYASLGVRVLAVEFRRPPEEPLPAAFEDLRAALTWARQTFPGRLVLGGDSGGAGLAVTTVLMMRDAGEPLPDALLAVYPMLDDRTKTTPAHLQSRLLWTEDDNNAAWAISTPAAAAHFIPARAKDLAGLPPTYFEVGTIDLFADETIHFAARSGRAGNAITLRTVPHAPHAYDLLVPRASQTRRSWAARRGFLLDHRDAAPPTPGS